jgi:hypothetical protein
MRGRRGAAPGCAVRRGRRHASRRPVAEGVQAERSTLSPPCAQRVAGGEWIIGVEIRRLPTLMWLGHGDVTDLAVRVLGAPLRGHRVIRRPSPRGPCGVGVEEGVMMDLQLTDASNEKLRRFLELTLEGPDIGKSDTTEASETSETSEDSESSEDTENSETTENEEMSMMLAVNPAPDEWAPILPAAEALLSSRLARPR